MVEITLILDYADCSTLYKSFWWENHIKRIIESDKCIAWNSYERKYDRNLVPMPGTTDPNWGEKHWGKNK